LIQDGVFLDGLGVGLGQLDRARRRPVGWLAGQAGNHRLKANVGMATTSLPATRWLPTRVAEGRAGIACGAARGNPAPTRGPEEE
jgi:hypothetical protein